MKKSVETNSEIAWRYLNQRRGVADPQGEIFRFSVVGHRHRDCLSSDKVRHFLAIDPEPENQHDPFAIRVFDGDRHIGYVAADETQPLHEVWDRIGKDFWIVNGPDMSAFYLVRLNPPKAD